MYYKLLINKTASSSLNEAKSFYDTVEFHFTTLEKLVAELHELYPMLNSGNLSKKDKIYIDKNDGDTELIGFCISFWDDVYGECRKLHETHWIEITEVIKSPVDFGLIKQGLKALEAKK